MHRVNNKKDKAEDKVEDDLPAAKDFKPVPANGEDVRTPSSSSPSATSPRAGSSSPSATSPRAGSCSPSATSPRACYSNNGFSPA